MKRLLCVIGWHRPSVKPEWAIAWECVRCKGVFAGKLAR